MTIFEQSLFMLSMPTAILRQIHENFEFFSNNSQEIWLMGLKICIVNTALIHRYIVLLHQRST